MTSLEFVNLAANRIDALDGLTDNSGFDDNDYLSIRHNLYDCQAADVTSSIQALLDRGVTINHDCW